MKFKARIRVNKNSYKKMVEKYNCEKTFPKLFANIVPETDDDIISTSNADEIYIESNSDFKHPFNPSDEDSVYISFDNLEIINVKTYHYLLYCIECCEKFSYVFIKLNTLEIEENNNEPTYEIEYIKSVNKNAITSILFPYDDIEEEDCFETYIIHTDGSCLGNPGKGGWAAILQHNGESKEICGSAEYTTNNQMELKAVIEALKTTPEKAKVEIYSDSNYVLNPITQNWISKWIKKSWMGSNNKPIANREMWQKLIELIKTREVSFYKVPAHADNVLNNRCDELAKSQWV